MLDWVVLVNRGQGKSTQCNITQTLNAVRCLFLSWQKCINSLHLIKKIQEVKWGRKCIFITWKRNIVAVSLVSLPTFETYSFPSVLLLPLPPSLLLFQFLLPDIIICLIQVLFWWLRSSSILDDTTRHSVTLAFERVTYDMMEWNMMIILIII